MAEEGGLLVCWGDKSIASRFRNGLCERVSVLLSLCVCVRERVSVLLSLSLSLCVCA